MGEQTKAEAEPAMAPVDPNAQRCASHALHTRIPAATDAISFRNVKKYALQPASAGWGRAAIGDGCGEEGCRTLLQATGGPGWGLPCLQHTVLRRNKGTKGAMGGKWT